MKTGDITLCLGISLILLTSSRAETFSDQKKTINENQNCTVRGVINIVYLPVPDALELKEPIQSGYFLFTPQRLTVNGKDLDGKPVRFKDQQMFHLTPTDDQVEKIKAALGKPVEVEVRPFIRNTRYQLTDVLFEILSFKIL